MLNWALEIPAALYTTPPASPRDPDAMDNGSPASTDTLTPRSPEPAATLSPRSPVKRKLPSDFFKVSKRAPLSPSRHTNQMDASDSRAARLAAKRARLMSKDIEKVRLHSLYDKVGQSPPVLEELVLNNV